MALNSEQLVWTNIEKHTVLSIAVCAHQQSGHLCAEGAIRKRSADFIQYLIVNTLPAAMSI